MGFKPVKMKIAKISVKKEQGRLFLKEIGESSKFELEIIDLVKTANIDPSEPSELESQIIRLHDEFSTLKTLLNEMELETKGRMNFENSSLSEINKDAQSLLEKTEPFIKKLESIDNLKEDITNFKQLIMSFEEIKDLGIQNIQDLGEGSHFYAVIGLLKGIHQYRLEMALDQLTGGDFILNPVQAGTAKIICLVGVMKSYQAALGRLLSGLGFEELKFPKELQGTPSEAYEQAKTELRKKEQEINNLQQEIKGTSDENGLAIRAMEEQLAIERQRLRVLQRTRQRNERYIIWAWLPGKDTKRLLKAIQQIDSSIIAEFIDPKLDPSEFPTKVRNNIYSRPFENLVHGFGPPGYNEWDPTKFLSILIPIFFGIMFADVFDGFVVLLLGLYGVSLKPSKYSKNAMLAEMQTYFDKGGPILCYIGSTAMIMGFLFGSYRGLAGEHALESGLPILPPLWFSPEIEGGQFALLELAILIGSLVIGAALLLQFLGSWSHDKSEAIFLPGMFLLFYIGLILLLFTFGPNPMAWFSATEGTFDFRALQTIAQSQKEVLSHHHIEFTSLVGTIFENSGVIHWGIPVFPIPGINLSYPLVLFIVPLILSSIYHFRHGMDGISELLDYIITTISNTISFARLFAYTMVHGSLSLVFIQIFELIFVGNPIPGMILGGFVVIPLELLVSFLQSLRLCWVEFFGKLHYQGSGYLFQPFKEIRLFSSAKN